MEKQNGEAKKKVKILNTSSIQINQQQQQQQQIAFQLVGSIVEKGIDGSGMQKKTTTDYSFPKPTVVPFPVARHRSHGPVSNPITLFLIKFQPVFIFSNVIKQLVNDFESKGLLQNNEFIFADTLDTTLTLTPRRDL
jgi:hypothetical protein